MSLTFLVLTTVVHRWGIDWESLSSVGMPWLRDYIPKPPPESEEESPEPPPEEPDQPQRPIILHQTSASTEINVDLGDTTDSPASPGCLFR